ncbi:hypothetical protein ACVWZA_001555 [Sphingomonas sp. UYAg733]
MNKRNVFYAFAIVALLGSYFVETQGLDYLRFPLYGLAAVLGFIGYSSPPEEQDG